MSHVVGTVLLELHFPNVHSLKEKRSVIKGLLARVKQTFNVSVAEVGHHDLWQRSLIAVAVVSASAVEVGKSLEAVTNFVESNLPMGQVIDVQKEVL